MSSPLDLLANISTTQEEAHDNDNNSDDLDTNNKHQHLQDNNAIDSNNYFNCTISRDNAGNPTGNKQFSFPTSLMLPTLMIAELYLPKYNNFRHKSML
eukprot:5382853-Ditylum_brightwellii.AAC.2